MSVFNPVDQRKDDLLIPVLLGTYHKMNIFVRREENILAGLKSGHIYLIADHGQVVGTGTKEEIK